MSGIFRFKQFSVNQQGCAMKVNTDGVLLGALTQANHALNILDIGTGTGVIALMLAQRFPQVFIDAVELDIAAAQTATQNFEQSLYANRLNLHTGSFQSYFDQHAEVKYDLMVSNPPFYIHSLRSQGAEKTLAKHADVAFFEDLMAYTYKHLHNDGELWLILPVTTATVVKAIAEKQNLFVRETIAIKSYPQNEPHRELLVFSRHQTEPGSRQFVIYDQLKQYSQEYQHLLRDFLTIF